MKLIATNSKVFISIYQWVAVIIITSIIIGTLSALFLSGLEWVTEVRTFNFWLVILLPLGGLLIGYIYYHFGKGVEGGNNRLIHEMILVDKKIHWKMTPLVLFGTWLTHLFGGSAGREGTAVQMGGAIADQFSGLFGWGKRERKVLLKAGVAAGFAGVFGTPLAGIIFAYELARDQKFDFFGVLPIVLSAVIADVVCHAWGVGHTNYQITEYPELSGKAFIFVCLAGLFFGLTALCFNYAKVFFTNQFNRMIKYPPLRPFVGGCLLVLVVLLLSTTKYLGLGISVIQASFLEQQSYEVFVVKLLLTALTLGAGFKGGEATPLFFMGATLGSALVILLPLPVSFLAALGFVAVFAGATNTPLASSIIGAELFGWEVLPYALIVCWIAYFLSGQTSVYARQIEELKKYSVLKKKNEKH